MKHWRLQPLRTDLEHVRRVVHGGLRTASLLPKPETQAHKQRRSHDSITEGSIGEKKRTLSPPVRQNRGYSQGTYQRRAGNEQNGPYFVHRNDLDVRDGGRADAFGNCAQALTFRCFLRAQVSCNSHCLYHRLHRYSQSFAV